MSPQEDAYFEFDRPEVRAVGETGLDYYRDSAPAGIQQEWFRAHIEIARQDGKALMIHDWDAHEDVLRPSLRQRIASRVDASGRMVQLDRGRRANRADEVLEQGRLVRRQGGPKAGAVGGLDALPLTHREPGCP